MNIYSHINVQSWALVGLVCIDGRASVSREFRVERAKRENFTVRYACSTGIAVRNVLAFYVEKTLQQDSAYHSSNN